MGSKDIIKAFETHLLDSRDCELCPYGPAKYKCDMELLNDVLELIKNQQAEIERLQNILDEKVIEFAYDKKQEIKTEAYKEFAKLSKERLTGWETDPTDEEIEDTLDDVLQELTERKEDEGK